jgi:hypothetical protein
MARYTFPTFVKSSTSRFIVLWELQRYVTSCQRLEAAMDLRAVMAATRRLEEEGWLPEGSAAQGIVQRAGVLLLLFGRSQHLAQRPVLRFREPARADVVLRLPRAMSRIDRHDAGFDNVGENSTEQPDRSRSRTSASAERRLTVRLLC